MANIISVNGSSSTGQCSGAIKSTTGVTRCLQPTSSVLFDGEIPALLEEPRSNNEIWASQLLTVRSNINATEVIFDFSHTPDYVGVERIDLILYSCPSMGISVDAIALLALDDSLADISEVKIHPCDSLVRVCLPFVTTTPAVVLQFHHANDMHWLHLAEAKFYQSNDHACPPYFVINDYPDSDIQDHPTASEAPPVSLPQSTDG